MAITTPLHPFQLLWMSMQMTRRMRRCRGSGYRSPGHDYLPHLWVGRHWTPPSPLRPLPPPLEEEYPHYTPPLRINITQPIEWDLHNHLPPPRQSCRHSASTTITPPSIILRPPLPHMFYERLRSVSLRPLEPFSSPLMMMTTMIMLLYVPLRVVKVEVPRPPPQPNFN